MNKNKTSVTRLIQLLDKPALMKWANKIGLNGIKLSEFRKQSTSHGTNLHKQIESYLMDSTPFEDKMFGENFMYFFRDKEIIEFEKDIENEYFTGRFDIKFKYKDLIYIADFKTNAKGVYFEHKLQLSAYRMASGCDKVAIVSIPDFRFYNIDIEDHKPYEEIMISLSNIFSIKAVLGC